MLNIVLLIHFAMALIFGVFAMFFPQLLAMAGTFNPGLVLLPPGKIYGMLFGITLIGVATLLWGARVSPSTPTRRLTLQVMFVHLFIGALVSLLLFPIVVTKWIAFAIFVLLFIAYGYIWLYRPGEI